APHFPEPLGDVAVEVGDSVTLLCRVEGSPPPEVTWSRQDGKPVPRWHVPRGVPSQPEAAELLIDSKSRGSAGASLDDQAVYICEAQNEFGRIQAEVKLTVTGHAAPELALASPVVRVLPGQPVSLPCVVLAGRPFPARRWLKDGQLVAPGSRYSIRADGSLHVEQALQEDVGRYTCEVTNALGSHQQDVSLLIHVPPSIEPGPVLITATEGLAVALQCNATGVPLPTITWAKGTEPILPSPHYHLDPDGTLLIPSPSPEDAGTYFCTATNTAGFSSQEMQLSVSTKPRISVNGSRASEPISILALPGQETTLPCEVQGHPPPLVVWTQESQPLLLTTDRYSILPSGSLRLTDPQVTDTGRYTCTATNAVGNTSLSYNLHVQAPPQLLIGDGESHLTAVANDSLRIQCHATGTPTPQIQWLKDGRPLGEQDGAVVSEGGGTLLIARVGLAHEGLYTCQDSNWAGVAQAEVQVSVQVPPNIEPSAVELAVLENGTVSLECLASGLPAPDIVWYKGHEQLVAGPGQALSQDGKLLEIQHAQLSHAGTYRCVASNVAGVTELWYSLQVTVPPRITAGPSPLTVVVNERVTLECDATGTPAPVLLWLKDGNPVSSMVASGLQILSGGHVLSLPTARLRDSGTYTCVASSAVGEDRREATLQVRLSSTALGEEENISVIVNQSVTLECLTPGVPPQESHWLKDGNLLTPRPDVQLSVEGTVLQIGRAAVQDAGRYTCQAPGHQRHYNLDVWVPPSFSSAEPTTVSVLEGQPVRLTCECHGIPLPTLSWWKDGEPLSTQPGSLKQVSTGGGVLYIEKVRLVDEGMYTCECRNSIGSSSKEQRLEVHGELGSSDTGQLYGWLKVLSSLSTQGPAGPKSWQPLPAALGVLGRMLLAGDSPLLHPPAATIQTECLGTHSIVGEGVAAAPPPACAPLPAALPRTRGSSHVPRKVSVIRAGETVLECEATGSPPPRVTWVKDGQPVAAGDGLLLRERGRRLHIPRAEVTHTGRYTCLVENVVGQEQKDFDVVVHVPPEFVQGSGSTTNVSVSLQGSMTLTCEATGIPLPTVTWSWDGSPVTPSEHIQVLSGGWMLRLTRAQAQDGGHYSCLASNVAGEARRHFYVEVLVPPYIENVDEEETIKVPEGHPVTWSCLAAGNPHPKVTWMKDGHPLPTGDTSSISPDGSVLHIPQASLSDAGSYSCMASNSVGNQTKYYLLDVLAHPTFAGDAHDGAAEEVTVIINNPISLVCEALAYPSPNITWLKDEVPLKASGNILLLPGGHGLQILNAQEDDAGMYSCIVASEAGEVVKNYAVKVLVPPWIARDDPLGEFAVKEVKTRVNSTVTLECETWAVPEPTIQWYKDKKLLESSSHLQILSEGQVLQIQPARVSDSGHYTCVATNTVGEDDRDFIVHVQVPPLFQQQMSSNEALEMFYREEDQDGEVTEHRQAVLNQPTALYCDTNSIPPPQISWYKDGEPLSPGPGVLMLLGGRVLQLPVVREEDAGRYTCETPGAEGQERLHYELENLAEEGTATVNGTICFKCEAAGHPVPTVSWLWNDIPIVAGPRHHLLEGGMVLQVTTVETGDTGSYTCVAENPAGSAERHFALTVQESSWTVGPNPKNVDGINSSISLVCDIQSHPTVEPSWYKDGHVLQLSEEVTRTPVPPVLNSPETREEQMVAVGSDVTFTCEATGSPAPTVTWLKDGKPLARQGSWVPSGPQLSLVAVGPADTGLYSCLVANEVAEASKAFHLLVTEPPRVEAASYPTEMSITVGTSLELTCVVTGVPTPTVTWEKDGQLLAGPWLTSGNESTLRIETTEVADAGLYTCLATSPAGEDSRSFHISIQAPLSITSVGETPSITTVAGGQLILECPGDATLPPRIEWHWEGSPLRAQIEAGEAPDGGHYSCRGTSARGGTSLRAQVEVHVAPEIQAGPEEARALLNSSVVLPCQARGWPVPQVTWWKDGQLLPLRGTKRLQLLPGGSLQISSVQLQDSGYYLCTASSPAGSDRRGLDLHVLASPTIAPGPSNLTLLAQQPATLGCDTWGSPEPHVRWEKDGHPLNTHVPLGAYSLQPSGSLLITSPGPWDEGQFECIASNAAGEARKVFLVSVHVPPTI
ncbi:PREDICTED: hemicentin-2-like, partial [Merops nubicus]|uniref:hemicentin-2-like n=1 Tax=Merops nubicus TaxID=57421 RepID=UPI0004F07E31